MLTPDMAMVLARTAQREREQAAAAYRLRRHLRRHRDRRRDSPPGEGCRAPGDRCHAPPSPDTDGPPRGTTG